MPARPVYPKPDDQPPVCPHCDGTDLVRAGRVGTQQRQQYRCRACRRVSYGVRPLPRLKCPAYRGTLGETRFPDGRIKFICSGCGKCQMSEYIRSRRKQKETSPCRHQIAFALDRHARAGLVEYVQATRSTDAQAVRALFRYVLTGKVFYSSCVVSSRPTRPVPVPRDPQVAAIKFPNLIRELALKRLDRSRGYSGRGFQSLVLSVGKVSVKLDDAAKEGLVYVMNRLEMNHVDAARWLLANVRVPDSEPAVPLRTIPAPAFGAATSTGRRISSYRPVRYDPRWDGD